MDTFWKPKRPIKNKFNLNVQTYPARTKREWGIIDKKPFYDSDKDRVPNWFDCKPLDKKQQAYILRREIAKRLFGEPSFGVKTRPQTRRRKQIQRLAQKIIKEEYAEKIKDPYRYVEGKRIKYKRVPKIQTKIHTEKDIVRFFEKNPQLIKQAEQYSWALLSPKKTLGKYSGLYGEFASPHTVEEELKGKEKMIRIFSSVPRRKDTRETIIHELTHGEQYKEGYWTSKYGKYRHELEEDIIEKINKLRELQLPKKIEKELEKSYRVPTMWSSLSQEDISDKNRLRKEIIEAWKHNPKVMKERLKEVEKMQPYYHIYDPYAPSGKRFKEVKSKTEAYHMLKNILSKEPENRPIRWDEIPYSRQISEIDARKVAKEYLTQKKVPKEAQEELLKEFDIEKKFAAGPIKKEYPYLAEATGIEADKVYKEEKERRPSWKIEELREAVREFEPDIEEEPGDKEETLYEYEPAEEGEYTEEIESKEPYKESEYEIGGYTPEEFEKEESLESKKSKEYEGED